MSDTEQDPLITDGDDPEIELPVEEPPPYEGKWGNSRPIYKSDEEDAPPSFPRDYITSQPAVIGPRRVEILRAASGFGFTIGGGSPVHIVEVEVGGPAALQGIKSGDMIFEAQGVDVSASNIDAVTNIIQAARPTVSLVIGPGVVPDLPPAPQQQTAQDLWRSALQAFENSSTSVDAVDPTRPPPTNLVASVLSIFCCPCVGCAATSHALQVMPMWRAENHSRSRAHSMMSKKLSSVAVFYGILFILFILFVMLSKRIQPPHATGDDGDESSTVSPW